MAGRAAVGMEPTVALQPLDFRAVYRAEVAYVCASLRRLGVRPADVEDMAHDVFVKVYRLLGDYDATRPLRPWLFGIALRTATDYRRAARFRHEVAVAAPDRAHHGAAPDEALAQREAHDLIVRALDTMDLDARAILTMHDLDDTPAPEIATVLGIPVNTVYSRLRLARAKFTRAARHLQRRRGQV
jgi:RNA polymerase sigma-70 factor (ECF subfamily)